MKFINSVSGTVALHLSGDEVVPETGINPAAVIEYLSNTYGFTGKPQLIPGAHIGGQNLVFSSGTFIAGEKKWPILQLASVPNGDLVTAATTEIAEMILDDYVKRLDADLGFRFAKVSKSRRSYQSNIVVQFENGLEEKIEALKKIEEILEKEIPRGPAAPFKIKRLAWGYGQVVPVLTLETMGQTDFAIERRSGEPYSENRYFCNAPMKSADHIKLLEKIESELG